MVRHGVCHRDLKTDNLLVDKSGGFEFPLLSIADFGCCLVRLIYFSSLIHLLLRLIFEGGNKMSISSTFYSSLLRQYFCTKKYQSQIVIWEKLLEALLYKKFTCKMLMKLTQGGLGSCKFSWLHSNNFYRLTNNWDWKCRSHHSR